MKSAMFPLFLLLSLSACSAGSADTKVATSETPAEQPAGDTHACPMHPEITGQVDDDCSICGMKLTEVIRTPTSEKKKAVKEHSEH